MTCWRDSRLIDGCGDHGSPLQIAETLRARRRECCPLLGGLAFARRPSRLGFASGLSRSILHVISLSLPFPYSTDCGQEITKEKADFFLYPCARPQSESIISEWKYSRHRVIPFPQEYERMNGVKFNKLTEEGIPIGKRRKGCRLCDKDELAKESKEVHHESQGRTYSPASRRCR